MDSATAWKVRGVGRETRVFAEDAARRAGLSLGDWLDEVIADRAAERGVDPIDLRRDDRLDAIGERIARLTRRDERYDDEPRARPRLEPRWSREGAQYADPRRNDDLLEAAMERLENRAERAEALQAAAERLSMVEQRVERTLEPRARNLDARLDALARRMDSEPERRREPVRQIERALERPRFDPQEAAAQIARRRSELDHRPAPRPVVSEAPVSRAAATASESLRAEVLAISARLEKMHREQGEQAVPGAEDVKALRAELTAMSRSLTELAPRNAVVALEGAMRDLGERIATLRDSGARDALTGLIAELRELLRAHNPQSAVIGLEREIRAIGAKVDVIAEGVIDPAVLQRIRAQTEEVRNLLAAAATRPVPVDRLERQMSELADRVDRFANSPAPQAESARLGALLADARAQIERSTPAAALAAIERRLEDLAKRMDQALQRPSGAGPIDPRLFEDLARRIENVRASVERQPDSGKLEAALRDISQKLDRSAPVGLEALSATVRELGARIDQRPAPALDVGPLEHALRALSDRPIEIDTAPIEAMMRDLGAKISAPPAPDMRPFESLLREISQKLDRGASEASGGMQVDADLLASQIADIHDRLDSLQTGAPANSPLGGRIEDLIAELDATRHALQSPGAPEPVHLVEGLAELRADQEDADRRTQSRLGNVQDILEKLVVRLGRLEDEIARVDEAPPPRAATALMAPAFEAPLAPPSRATEPFRAANGAALRDVPEREAAPAQRAIDGANFLLEPGATLGRPRLPNSADADAPKSAINAHIAAARRAAQAAMSEGPGNPAAPAPAQGDGGLAALGGKLAAFAGQRRRPLLLAAGLVAALAMLAVIELKGGRVPLLQKSALDAPIAKLAAAIIAPAPVLAPTPTPAATIAADLDTAPTGAIAAPAKAPPADLQAAIPANLAQPLHDAAVAGDVGAEFELGLRLLDGRSVARDPHAAAQWIEQAANRGLPIAQYRLAALYEKGIGVTRDPPTAMSLYVKAASAGNARAMHNLAVMHAEGSIGGKPDYATAAEWFRKAGQLGVRDSQFNLGILYARGLGVPQDLGQAWLWFSLAAQQGDTDAGHKRDDVVGKMDANAAAAAKAAIAAFKLETPAPAANEAPTPPGGWDKSAPQASATPAKPATAL